MPGPLLWSLDHAAEALRFYREFIPAAPEAMNAFFAFLKVPPAPAFPEALHGQTVCGVVCCYGRTAAPGEKVVQALHTCVPLLFEHLGPMPYSMLQRAFDAMYPPSLQWHWKGDFVNERCEEAMALHVQYGTHFSTLSSTMHLYPIDGAPHRIGQPDTAFSYRDATWSEVIVGVDPTRPIMTAHGMRRPTCCWRRSTVRSSGAPRGPVGRWQRSSSAFSHLGPVCERAGSGSRFRSPRRARWRQL